MNQAHLHLIFNHLPIIGTLIGILTLLAGFVLKSSAVKRTALGIFIFAALTAIPSMLTGEGAEEVVETLPGVSENLIEAHEELASIFIWVVSALGILSLITLIFDLAAKNLKQILYFLTLVLALGAMILGQKVGTSGGEIRHTEIRSQSGQAPDLQNGANENQKKSEKDDD
ncbi:MAG: hypothetical protein K1X92_15485 [Bacteroidia bacterium]|nr:hypothetical protein [Bacteroidia bacterium]